MKAGTPDTFRTLKRKGGRTLFPYDLSPKAVKAYLLELHREVEFMAGSITDSIEAACAVLEPLQRTEPPEMM